MTFIGNLILDNFCVLSFLKILVVWELWAEISILSRFKNSSKTDPKVIQMELFLVPKFKNPFGIKGRSENYHLTYFFHRFLALKRERNYLFMTYDLYQFTLRFGLQFHSCLPYDAIICVSLLYMYSYISCYLHHVHVIWITDISYQLYADSNCLHASWVRSLVVVVWKYLQVHDRGFFDFWRRQDRSICCAISLVRVIFMLDQVKSMVQNLEVQFTLLLQLFIQADGCINNLASLVLF